MPSPEGAGDPPSSAEKTSTTKRTRGALAALQHREFRFYAAGRFLATVALQMQGLAVGFQVYAITGRKIDLALIGLVQFLPIVTLSIGAGQLADRLDRRLILVACDVVFCVAAVGFYVLARSAAPSLVAILALLTLTGVARAFYGPAGSSLLPALVPREQFPNAVSLNSTLWQAAAIGGPSLGGAIYGLRGEPGPVYFTSAALLVLAGFFIAGMRPRPMKSGREPATLATALAGVRYVRRHKLLLGSISLDFFAVFLGGATALLPVYATDILHVGARGLGLLRSAPAIGAGLTAAYLAVRPLGRHAGAKMLGGVAIFGLATVVFGLSTSFPLSLAMLALLGAADMVSVVVRGTLVQAATPDRMRGRVSAVNMMFVGASNELGEFESGALAQAMGTVPSVVFGGLGTLLVVALWTWRFAPLRQVDRLEAVEPLDEELAEEPAVAPVL
jgi:MFS family permease